MRPSFASGLLIGGGLKGGKVVGKTDRDGAAMIDGPISVPDFLGTVYAILGIDYERKNHPPGVGRPIPIVDTSKAVNVLSELLWAACRREQHDRRAIPVVRPTIAVLQLRAVALYL